MKKIIVVQSFPEVLGLVKAKISATFPNLNGRVLYQSNFEKTLAEISKEEEMIVIASDSYHDAENILFKGEEKDGSRLAEEIKKINPEAKVYVFSIYEPKREYIDGFYKKSRLGDNTLEEIVEIFLDLGLNR
ncbi:MAG: hypothetical protein ACYC40_00935 [Patescibacteria group bacterium]